MKQFLLITLALLIFIPVFATTGSVLTPEDQDKIESELKIYPNPVKNNQVTFEFETRELTELRFVNITGKEVLKKVFDFPLQKATVLLNEIPNGLYIVQIKTSDEKIISKKLMISRN